MSITIQPTSDLQTRIGALTKLYGSSEVASRIGTSTRTIERWARAEVAIPAHVSPALDQLFGSSNAISRPTTPEAPLRFIDLFAGIGGIRLGMESTGAECVYTSEWDKYAVRTYTANHNSLHEIAGDITAVPVEDIPDHEILAAGFPCQPFSLAGVSKKTSLGRMHGFLDKTQGTLFFNVAAVLAEKRPRAFLLENVKNLVSHDRGRTFEIIRDVLEKDLGYTLHWKVVDAKGFVPQHRERIMMVGLRDGGSFDWSKVAPPAGERPTMASVFHQEDGSETAHDSFVDGSNGKVLDKYILSDRLWAYLQAYAAKHKAAGNGFGYGLVTPESTSRTLSARYHKDGSEILVWRGEGLNPRRLTPRECARLMGFSDDFRIPVSDTQAYRQFGNSVAVPVIAAVAKELTSALARTKS